jgi:hypothetical protein
VKITDTTRNPKPDGIGGGNPGAIEQQEARGQRELVASSQLPRNGLEFAESRGIVVHAGGNDPLFVDVTLPAGWKIVPTEHSMWSDLVDDAGVKRASIFYKAAFYDRVAFIQWMK